MKKAPEKWRGRRTRGPSLAKSAVESWSLITLPWATPRDSRPSAQPAQAFSPYLAMENPGSYGGGTRLVGGFVLVGMEFSPDTETPLLLTGKQFSHLDVRGGPFNIRESQAQKEAASFLLSPRGRALLSRVLENGSFQAFPEADFSFLPKEGLEQGCFGISSRCIQLLKTIHGKVLFGNRVCVCARACRQGRLGFGNHL